MRRFEIKARTAASKTIEVEVDKPLGLTLGQKQGGGVVITVSFVFTTSAMEWHSCVYIVLKLMGLVFRVWKEVAMQQKLGLNLGIKFCTQAASLEMSFGLQIS